MQGTDFIERLRSAAAGPVTLVAKAADLYAQLPDGRSVKISRRKVQSINTDEALDAYVAEVLA